MIFDNNYLGNKNQLFNSPWTVIFFHIIFNFSERNYNFNCLIEADQLSEYDDKSSDDNESVLEEDGAVHQLLNKDLSFLFTAPRTRGGRMVRTSNKAVLWL